MTDSTFAPEAAAQATPASAGSWATRWSDRCNPILVREVQQAVKGRVFYLLVLVTLVVDVAIAIYVAGAQSDEVQPRLGQDAFSAALMALAALVLFVVPMQAYQSMRLELRSGIVEQLLLTRLRPRRIVVGKLAAALVQFFLYLSVLGPVLATTYLLRGVDVPTIAVVLGLALVFCLAATALAIAAAAQGVLPLLQPLANAGIAFSLGMATIGVLAAIGGGEMVRGIAWLLRRPEAAPVLTGIAGIAVVVTVLGSMVAASLLAHTHENRSTPFRVLLLVVTGLVYAWICTFVPRTDWPVSAAIASAFLIGAMGVLGVFFVTESARLSPRQRRMVPRSSALALLIAPLLPGRDRGLLFLVGWLALLGAIVWLFGQGVASGRSFREMRLVQGFLAVYVMIFLMLTRLVRSRLPETLNGNMAARMVLPVLLLLTCGVPALFDALVAGGVDHWHVGHSLDPFFTMAEFVDRRRDGFDVLAGLGCLAGGLFVLLLPQIARSVTEVMSASAANRAPAPPEGDASA